MKGLTYANREVESGIRYYYVVRAVDEDGGESRDSDEALRLCGGVRRNRGGLRKNSFIDRMLENRTSVHLFLKYAPPKKTSADWELAVGWFHVHHCLLASESVQIGNHSPKNGPGCQTDPIHSG